MIITKVTKGWVKVWQCCSHVSMKHKAAATSLLREVWSSQIKFWGGIRRDPLWIIETCTPNHRHFLAIKDIYIYIQIHIHLTVTRQLVHTFHSRYPRSSIGGPSGGRSFFCSFCTRAWRAEVSTKPGNPKALRHQFSCYPVPEEKGNRGRNRKKDWFVSFLLFFCSRSTNTLY